MLKRNLIFVSLAAVLLASGTPAKAQVFVPDPYDVVSVADTVATIPYSDVEEPVCEVEVELDNRSIVSCPGRPERFPEHSGDVRVSIIVNRYGEVSQVTLLNEGTTVDERDVFDAVFEDAFATFFSESSKAPVFQTGSMVYRFLVPYPEDHPVRLGRVRVVIDPEQWDASQDSLSVEGVSMPVDTLSLRGQAEEVEAPEKSQEAAPVISHLEFKHVPIDGPVVSVVQALKDEGFVYKGVRGEIGILEGSFAGVEHSRVMVLGDGKNAYKVIVDFPCQQTWNSMKNQYLYFKRSYASKYFSTPSSVEKFPSYSPEGSGREHIAIKEETAVYRSTFEVPSGLIVVSVQPGQNGEGKFFLRLEYVDGVNSARRDSVVIEDI